MNYGQGLEALNEDDGAEERRKEEKERIGYRLNSEALTVTNILIGLFAR